MLAATRSSRCLLVQPHSFCMISPISEARLSAYCFETRKHRRVRRSRTSSMSVTNSFLMIHYSSARVVDPKTLSILPLAIWVARDPKLLQSCTPRSFFSLNSFSFSFSEAEPMRGSPLVCEAPQSLPCCFSFWHILSTSSSPIFLQVVHLPPMRLSRPLSNSSMTWLRETFLVSLSASSTTRGLSPHQRVLSRFMNLPGSISLMMSSRVVLMKERSDGEQTGLLVGSLNLVSVVPAMTLLSQGTTRMMRPSGLGAQSPKVLLATWLSQVMWLPPTAQILLWALGLSFSLILSAHAPVQLTTYLALIRYSLLLIRSRTTTPLIVPFSSFMKSRNSVRFRALAGWKRSGICMPLPQVAVSRAERRSRASLKEPSSQTTPWLQLGESPGKISLISWRLMRQGKLKVVLVLGAKEQQIRQYSMDPTQQQLAVRMLLQGITKGILVVRWGALSIIRLRYSIASRTRLNFSFRDDSEAEDSSNACCRYRTPPWISLVDLELAPEAKSSFSTRRVRSPLVEASSRTPTPLQPPPMTTTSQLGLSLIYLTCCFLDLKLRAGGVGEGCCLPVSSRQLQPRERSERAARDPTTDLILLMLVQPIIFQVTFEASLTTLPFLLFGGNQIAELGLG